MRKRDKHLLRLDENAMLCGRLYENVSTMNTKQSYVATGG